jgi:competence protein ComEA
VRTVRFRHLGCCPNLSFLVRCDPKLLRGFFATVVICLSTAVTAVAAGVDVNLATVQQLTRINGIGAATAQRIVAERARGPYESLEHLAERLSGIGAKRLAKLKAAGLCAGARAKPCAAPEPRAQLTIPRKSNGDVATPEVIQLP